jgi:iron complex transport system substrate-binding protein
MVQGSRIKHIIAVILLVVATVSTGSAEDKAYPKRIISLTPASTEILFALGLDNRIIAVSSYCQWPKQAKLKQKIGSFSNPNIEKIIRLKPDLVLVTGMEQKNLQIILASLGIDYISVDPKNIDELINTIEQIGVITGAMQRAADINSNIKKTVGRIDIWVSKVDIPERPSVYVEIWHDPIMSPGKNSFLDDMIEKAGGINITSDLKRAYSRIDPEQIIYRNPEKIVLAYMKPDTWIKENFAIRPGWLGIKAVKTGNIYSGIDPDIILRPGPRAAEGLMELYRVFYEK